MSDELKITEAAKDAAENEGKSYVDRGWSAPHKPLGHFVQLAINAACAELREENERLKKQNDEGAKAFETLACSFPEIQVDCEDPNSAALLINEKYDQLLAREKELREIVKELKGAGSCSCVRFGDSSDSSQICTLALCDWCKANHRYTTFLAAHQEGK